MPQLHSGYPSSFLHAKADAVATYPWVQVCCSLVLRNLQASHTVAFKIKTTNPHEYCVRPRVGAIPPKAELHMHVYRLPARTFKPCVDHFLLEVATLASEDMALRDSDFPPPEQQVRLRATLVGASCFVSMCVLAALVFMYLLLRKF